MHGESINALSRQLILLVLHQCDEGADDDRQAIEHESRQLVDERLAASRRHHDERVAALQEGIDGLPLPPQKGFMSEPTAE